MIQLIQEGNSIFAVEQNVEKNGKLYDELLFGEIFLKNGKIFVTFEDDWQTKVFFETVDSAKAFIISNYFKHTPFVNGAVTDID